MFSSLGPQLYAERLAARLLVNFKPWPRIRLIPSSLPGLPQQEDDRQKDRGAIQVDGSVHRLSRLLAFQLPESSIVLGTGDVTTTKLKLPPLSA